MGKFQCTRCGGCCKALLDGRSGHLFGLFLDPSEIGLFPEGTVFPLLGSGTPVQATAYQLGVNRCPHYEEDPAGLGRCGIRERRPLACRAFPVISRFSVSGSCRSVRQNPDGLDRGSLKDELEAHDRKLGQMLERPQTEWVWPLELGRWIPVEKDHDRDQSVHPA